MITDNDGNCDNRDSDTDNDHVMTEFIIYNDDDI